MGKHRSFRDYEFPVVSGTDRVDWDKVWGQVDEFIKGGHIFPIRYLVINHKAFADLGMGNPIDSLLKIKNPHLTDVVQRNASGYNLSTHIAVRGAEILVDGDKLIAENLGQILFKSTDDLFYVVSRVDEPQTVFKPLLTPFFDFIRTIAPVNARSHENVARILFYGATRGGAEVGSAAQDVMVEFIKNVDNSSGLAEFVVKLDGVDDDVIEWVAEIIENQAR